MKHTLIRSIPFCLLLLSVGAPAPARAAEHAKSGNYATQDGSQPAPGTLWLADFEKGKAESLVDTPCEQFTDSSLGGKSSVELSVVSGGAQGSKHALRMTGKLTTDFQWGGFVGFRVLLQPGGAPKNLSAFTGVQFYARGDGRKYSLLVSKENIKDSNHFSSEFTAGSDWTLVRVPFTKLKQSPNFGTQVSWSAENIDAVGFLARAEPGATAEANLELDQIGFYTEK
jgi:hypothetical protein